MLRSKKYQVVDCHGVSMLGDYPSDQDAIDVLRGHMEEFRWHQGGVYRLERVETHDVEIPNDMRRRRQ